MARLKDYYQKDVAPALMKKFGYKSVMQIPKLEKIVVNVACGEAVANSKVLDSVVSDLAKIRSEAADLPREKIRCKLQAPGRDADRRKGYPARRNDVRVPGPLL